MPYECNHLAKVDEPIISAKIVECLRCV